MRKVFLTMNENEKYDIIKKLVDSNSNKLKASLKLGCTVRHINRLIAGYKKEDKSFFIHGNRGRKPAHALSPHTKQLILDLYINKYSDCNLTHFCELLKQYENISVSVSTISSILKDAFILSPKAHRRTKKALKKHLNDIKKHAPSSEVVSIDSALLSLEDAHRRRPRASYAGELLQMDASVHL